MEGKYSNELREFLSQPAGIDPPEIEIPPEICKPITPNPYQKKRDLAALADPAYYPGSLERKINSISSYIVEEAKRLGIADKMKTYALGRLEAERAFASGEKEAPNPFALSFDLQVYFELFQIADQKNARDERRAEQLAHIAKMSEDEVLEKAGGQMQNGFSVDDLREVLCKRVENRYSEEIAIKKAESLLNSPYARLFRLWEAFNEVSGIVPDVVNGKSTSQSAIAVALCRMLSLGQALVGYTAGERLKLTREKLEEMEQRFNQERERNEGLLDAVVALRDKKDQKYITLPEAAGVARDALGEGSGKDGGYRSEEAIKKELRARLESYKAQRWVLGTKTHYYPVLIVAKILADWKPDWGDEKKWGFELGEKALSEGKIRAKWREKR
jgi:hypothetical protein